MNFFRSKRGIAAVAAVLLILFVFRPGVFELRNRICNTIGMAVGRRVTIDNVRLHALPRPGFDLEGLVVYDDPLFSAEPMIRAQDVFAAIRLRSLLHGRLEIATLSATEPSINLVRNSEGRWNLASLIQRNAQIPAAPTQKASSERRPAFPYLEASNARINFKFGPEKTFYALTDADVALWQDSENSWGARLKAQPVRTDLNLNDTGRVQMNATWQRETNLRHTPMRLDVSWQRGQLGQITTLLTGKDRGWRGAVDLTGSLEGTPEALTVEGQTAIQGFRRYDIVDDRNIRLATHCTSRYDAIGGSLANLLCESPVKSGILRVSGNVASIRQPARYDLTVEAKKIPVSSVIELLHEAKQSLPADLAAEGSLDGEFRAVRRDSGPAQISGSGTANEVRLSSNGGNDLIALNDVPLSFVGENCCSQIPKHPGNHREDPSSRASLNEKIIAKIPGPEPSEPHLQIGPVSLVINASAPLTAQGWISTNGYRFSLRGDAGLKNLYRIENAFGVLETQPAAEGSVKLDMSISGAWQGLAAPNALGTAQLRNIRAEMRGLNAPIEIASATIALTPEATSVQQLSARLGETRWTGSLRAPRHCAPNCIFQFDLNADQLSTKALAEWFTPRSEKRPWYRIISGEQVGPSPLFAIRARGNLRVGQFEMKKASATELTTEMSVDRGKITLASFHAHFLQGTYQGNWTIDASVQPVAYRGTGTIENLSLEKLCALMNDVWITGNADGSFDVKTTGTSFREMLTNSDANLVFIMRNGSLPHVDLPGAPVPLPVHRFSGNLRLTQSKWQLTGGRLESRDGIYRVSGSTADAGLDFVFTRADEQSWNLTGTLAKLHTTPANQEMSRTEANTKTEAKP